MYAGHDTKLVQNSGRTKFKRTHLDLFINKLVIFVSPIIAVPNLLSRQNVRGGGGGGGKSREHHLGACSSKQVQAFKLVIFV